MYALIQWGVLKPALQLALRLWALANIAITLMIVVYTAIVEDAGIFFLLVWPIGSIISIPVVPFLVFTSLRIRKQDRPVFRKIEYFWALMLVTAFFMGLVLTAIYSMIGNIGAVMNEALLFNAGLLLSVLVAAFLSQKQMTRFFNVSLTTMLNTNKMETTSTNSTVVNQESVQERNSSGILTKGLITAGLILVMMIPTFFISNLVSERQARQKDVAAEVSSKWSSSQTLSGPFLFVPYMYTAKDKDGKLIQVSNHFWILPDELKVTGSLEHQLRPRSIYKVLLYKAALAQSGYFNFKLPSDISPEQVQWNEVRVCLTLSDFKGIESRVLVKTNGTDIELSPGLPNDEIAGTGLSAPAGLSAADIGKQIPFSSGISLRGSERLHFLPMGGNSSFDLRSKWPAPSFDGNNLPTERSVNDSGFNAKWTFNKANLPFGTTLRNPKFNVESLAFGVTMVQPADQYAKTDRAVKYAILVIGLTFSLFFIMELMQKQPVHPVQYVLVGLALVIFYTLLLSISEFLLFDIAYAIAAIATVTLITLYVRSHFRNWRASASFGTVLCILYLFIFVLVRLEDTALLIGSIGLFLILAIAMYFSRKIEWR